MQTHEVTDEETAITEAIGEALADVGDIAEYYGLDRARFGEALVQALLVTLRVRNPGDEWRERALEACTHAIDQSDRLQAQRPTHKVSRHAQ